MMKMIQYSIDLTLVWFTLYGTYWFITTMTPLYLWFALIMAMTGFVGLYIRYSYNAA